MAQQLQPAEKDIWTIVQTIIQIVNGRHNATGEVTLRTGQATTVVSHPNCSIDSVPLLTPLTAVAAAEVGNGTMYISAIANGAFTITHANSATANRKFRYSVAGG